ncbi:MAG: NAD(P)/FAD-dependent oxidoreductase [Anaerolineae bacterium]|nr:NAD(P)/FAD-dependent oxidoreductase [Anaerolineae bacterium]
MESLKKSDHERYDLVVVGGGPAGTVAALRARELGARVALVEKERMGGTCTNDGCVPTRVLAHVARLMREYEQFSQYGLRTEKPELDFEFLMRSVEKLVDRVHEKKQLINHLQQAGVDLISGAGPACFRDSHSLSLPDGRILYGDKYIICAGGHARRLPFPGSEHILTHSDIWSLRKLPKSLTIVGGAATGCQLASIFASLGAEVNLLEVNPRLLAAEDEEVSRAMRKAFEERGIHVITGIGGVQEIEKSEEFLRLKYRMGEGVEVIESNAITMAVGWIGNLESLNLDLAGVQHERGYIQVNDYMQTNVPHIFAAGDITGRMMLVQSASYDGRIAAENCLLGVGQPYRHQIVPHGGFTDPEYGSVGLTEAQARAKDLEIVTAIVPYLDLDRAVIDDHTTGFCKLIVSAETHRILGAHVVGEQALEVIQIVAAGMAADMWVEHLAELELPYPTYTAVVGIAARRILQTLGVVPLAPQWLTLGEPHLAEWERSRKSADTMKTRKNEG